MKLTGHGGKEVVERILPGGMAGSIISDMPELEVDTQTAHECIDIGYGFLSPLDGFMGSEEVDSVCEEMSLPDGTLWSIPITLEVNDDTIRKKGFREGDEILLTYRGKPLAIMKTGEVFQLDADRVASKIYGTSDPKHPGVRRTVSRRGKSISGKVILVGEPGFQPPFDRFWLTPRNHFSLYRDKGWEHVVAHQTRNVPHTAHEWLMKYCWFAANEDLSVEVPHTGVLVNAVIGEKRNGDYIDEAIILGQAELANAGYFRKDTFAVSFTLWDMRYAGPREAVHHAIMRTNLGCTHHMFGRDHAGVGDFYKPYDAHSLLKQVRDRLKIKPVFMMENWFCPICSEVTSSGLCDHAATAQNFSGTLLRSMLIDGVQPTRQVMRPEVFRTVQAASDTYGFGSPFVTDSYLANRGSVFKLADPRKEVSP
ncbi:MAG: sulfate adenylyltransferase [Thermoplasmataceae archaeon]